MKDSKFIELLNLYVDHQISAEDSARLEAEIQRDPRRRQIYRQYCQMQKACVTLAENFRTQAPAGGKIIGFAPANRRLTIATYAMGVLAAAACAAVVFVNRSRLQERAAVAANVPTELAIATQPVKAVVPSPVRRALQPVFTVRDNFGPQNSVNRVALDWMNQVQFQPVPAEELWFQSKPTLQTDDLLLRSRPAAESQAEMAAIRFQR